jgi:hypothetical protein
VSLLVVFALSAVVLLLAALAEVFLQPRRRQCEVKGLVF